MALHKVHLMHDNSIETYRDINICSDLGKVLMAYQEPIHHIGATDRGIMDFVNGSSILMGHPTKQIWQFRSRITELKKLGLIKECGKVKDYLTGQKVRICRIVE